MIPYFFNKFQRNKSEGLWNLAEIEITWRYGNFSNSANLDIAMFEKLPYPLVSAISVILNVLQHITLLTNMDRH